MGRADQVAALLNEVGLPLDDDDIAGRLGMNRHYVNAVCRDLASQGVISRFEGNAGKLVNQIARGRSGNQPTRAPASPPPTRRRQRRSDRARSNVEALIDSFEACVAAFESNEAFAGPSLYFHQRAITERRLHESAESAVRDRGLLELIYAVLPSWGMHRMGQQRAKVGDFATFGDSIRSQAPSIQSLWSADIRRVPPGKVDDHARRIWEIIDQLRVSTSRSKLVAGSKTLHHLLPDLVPPIDRQYTFHFFTGQTQVSHGEEAAFLEWFPLLCEVAGRCDDQIEAALARGGFMATSPAKVVDNAIMGFRQLSR